jgi:uncharacterized protein
MLVDHTGIPQLRDLASRSEQVSDSIRVSDMSRLAELLHPDAELAESELDVRIEFLGGIQGFPEISGHITGSLDIYCQRCLGSLDLPVDTAFRLVVIGSAADLDEIAEPFDVVLAGEQGIRLAEVIEDELLASLPLAPMHADLVSCETSIGVKFIGDAIDDTGDTTKVNSKMNSKTDSEVESDIEINRPFEDLAALLKDSKSEDKSDKK